MTTSTTSQRTRPCILVTLDGSVRDTGALSEAAALAAGLDAGITLLRVVRPPRATDSPTAGDLLPTVDRAERMVDAELRAHEATLSGLPVTRIVLVGTRPAEEIMGWLRAHPVDSVVMATEGKRGLRRLIGGSVADVVRRSGLAPEIVIDDHPEPKSRSTTRTGKVGVLNAA